MQGKVSPCWRACSILILWAENSGHLFKLPPLLEPPAAGSLIFLIWHVKKKKKIA